MRCSAIRPVLRGCLYALNPNEVDWLPRHTFGSAEGVHQHIEPESLGASQRLPAACTPRCCCRPNIVLADGVPHLRDGARIPIRERSDHSDGHVPRAMQIGNLLHPR